MSLINIPGMTEDSLTKMDAAPTAGGLRPFPCTPNDWTMQTGVVMKAGLKTFTIDGEPSENISIQVANGQYGAELLIGLDARRVPPGTKDAARTQQDNLNTIQKVIKMLGAHTGGKLDTQKLEAAHGMCCAFIVKHKGFQESNGRYYHKVSAIFKGEVPDYEEVVMVQMPNLPGQSQQQSQSTEYDPFGN